MQRGLRRGGAYAGSRAAKDVLQAANAKFHAGPDPLERESDLHVIQPSDRQQLEAMTKMLEETYKNNPTPQQKQALELWKFQVASGTVVDQVKFQFLRRFYFWLLGRGEQEDHEKTMWGRANTAVYNGEVAAYIDQFTSKRAQYAMKLQLLSMRIPDSLLGYYLYFKASFLLLFFCTAACARRRRAICHSIDTAPIPGNSFDDDSLRRFPTLSDGDEGILDCRTNVTASRRVLGIFRDTQERQTRAGSQSLNQEQRWFEEACSRHLCLAREGCFPNSQTICRRNMCARRQYRAGRRAARALRLKARTACRDFGVVCPLVFSSFLRVFL